MAVCSLSMHARLVAALRPHFNRQSLATITISNPFSGSMPFSVRKAFRRQIVIEDRLFYPPGSLFSILLVNPVFFDPDHTTVVFGLSVKVSFVEPAIQERIV